jgi:hypothetical protein
VSWDGCTKITYCTSLKLSQSGALILLEYTVLSPLVCFAFARRIAPPPEGSPYAVFVSPQQQQTNGHQEGISSGDADRPSVGWFVKQVLTFGDVFGVLDVPTERPVAGGSEEEDEDDGEEFMCCQSAL